ncbi:MAG: hypothetical protein O7A03_09820 [Alphaproteobacteria bacterium]|nr:hypothetical protein [Alphaproteobacteria bacterium]
MLVVLTILAPPAYGQVGPGGGQSGPGGAEFPLMVVERSFDQAVLLQLQLERFLLGDLFTAFQVGDALFVPFGFITRQLDFGIQVDLIQGRAQGFFIDENRAFTLDLRARRAVIEGQVFDIPPDAVELQFDDIFVDSRLFGQWFPLDLMFDPTGGVLLILPRETLPLQERLAREEGRNLGGGTELRQDFDLHPTPYTVFSTPALDLSTQINHTNANTSAPDNVDNSGSYSASLAGDLLFMNARLSFSGSDGDWFVGPRFVLERKDQGRRLFSGVQYVEALRLSEFAVGDVFTGQIPFVIGSSEGRGLAISNFPLNRPTEFDRQTFRGELPLGWEVELYRNDTLLDFRTSDQDARYEFLDVPLLFGINDFRFEFFGPQGQRRTELVRIPVGPTQQTPGDEFFRFAVVQEGARTIPFKQGNGDTGVPRYVVTYERGVTQNLSIAMNASSARQEDGIRHNTFGVGLRTALRDVTVLPNTFARVDWTNDLNGGHGVVAGLQTSIRDISITAEHGHFFGLENERLGFSTARLTSTTSARADGSLPEIGIIPSVSYGISLTRDSFKTGTNSNRLGLRLATNIADISVTNTFALNRDTATGSEENSTLTGALMLSGTPSNIAPGLDRLLDNRLISDVRLRSTLDYTLQTERDISGLGVTIDTVLAEDYAARLDINRSFGSPSVTSYAPSIARTFGSVSIGANGSVDSEGNFSAGISLSVGAVPDPRGGGVVNVPSGAASQGVVSIRTFIDANANSVFDAGDSPLPGIKFRDAQFADAITDAQGIAFIGGLGPYFETVVEIDERSIPDPFLKARPGGVDIIPRPGVVSVVDFPFVLTGEIDGFVILSEGGGLTPIAAVPIQLIDQNGVVVDEVSSTFDGFYLFTEVFPGMYLVQVPAEAIVGQGVLPPAPLPVQIGADGTILTGVDILLVR